MPASMSIPKSRSCCRSRKASTSRSAPRRRNCASAPRRTRSSAARTSWRAHLVDSGKLGKITSGTLHVMSHGMEHWHPNPDFFFQPGAGPVLDIGPYYITNLIHLIGPVKRVAALATIPRRSAPFPRKPRAGEKITVDTPTTMHALMEFANGAVDHAQCELGCLDAWPCTDRALWRGRLAVRARSELLRRRGALHQRATSR